MLASLGVATAVPRPAFTPLRRQPPGAPETSGVPSPASLPAVLLAPPPPGGLLSGPAPRGAAPGGAALPPADARVEVALSLVAALASAAWLFGPLRLVAPPLAWGGLGLLGLFALWSGVSLGWSVAADATWIAANRALASVLVVGLAFVFASSHPRAARRAVEGGVAIGALLALYALGGKVAPGIHVLGLDLDQTARIARLREPLDYWNALGLLCARGAVLALALVADAARRVPVRLSALAALFLFLAVLGFTYSRGGIVALVVALAVSLGLGGARLRSLGYVVLAALATVPGLAIAFSSPFLTSSRVPLAQREDHGLGVGLVLLASLVALLALAWLLMRLERRIPPNRVRSRWIGRGLALAAAVAALAGVGLVAASPRGLEGTASHTWRDFTRTREESIAAPAPLLL